MSFGKYVVRNFKTKIHMSDFLNNLNEEQSKAVTTTTGPVLILAGAGSGKTRVITYRIAYLLEQGVSAQNILAVTFTNKAAQEMKERVAHVLGNTIPDIWIGTFHSICVRILRREISKLGITSGFTIYDTSDQQQVIKEIIKELGYDEKLIKARSVQYKISSLKNDLITPEQFNKIYVTSFFDEKIAEVYVRYQKRLRSNNALDFDDLIFYTTKIFQEFDEVCERYQKLFQYILVDEYQDTNHAQYTLVNILAAAHHNICVVGDPDQSIYNFRGADIRNILNFESDYPDLKVFRLEENYRSTQNILAGAQGLIERNTQRKEKKIWTSNETGDCIRVIEVPGEREEGSFVVYTIRRLLQDNPSKNLNDCVVFYRTHAQSRALEESFLTYSVPYRIVGGLSFYERKEVKDILAYIRILENPYDLVSLKRIINTPARGIGEKTVDEVLAFPGFSLTDTRFLDDLPIKIRQKVQTFFDLYGRIKEASFHQSISSLMMTVVNESSYKEYLLDGTSEGEVRWENVKELLTVASRFDHLSPQESITAFLEDVSLVAHQEKKDSVLPAVTLMTIHGAKGLEFDYVFIVGVEENIFPHSQSMSEAKDVEEERRLCYVGITRARKKLYLLHARNRMIYGGFQNNSRSRFIDELPEDSVEFEQSY